LKKLISSKIRRTSGAAAALVLALGIPQILADALKICASYDAAQKAVVATVSNGCVSSS
jgi:hypothetical protein